jgi:topoisomerase IA-like protein
MNAAVVKLADAANGGGRANATSREPIQTFAESPVTGKPIKLLAGRFGAYVTDGETNATLPKDSDPSDADRRAGARPARRTRRQGPGQGQEEAGEESARKGQGTGEGCGQAKGCRQGEGTGESESEVGIPTASSQRKLGSQEVRTRPCLPRPQLSLG